jgi:hypothetical protein
MSQDENSRKSLSEDTLITELKTTKQIDETNFIEKKVLKDAFQKAHRFKSKKKISMILLLFILSLLGLIIYYYFSPETAVTFLHFFKSALFL